MRLQTLPPSPLITLTLLLSPSRTRYLPKVNITYNDNHTASFLLPLGAIFEPSMSVGTEEDKVTSLNLALVVSESLFYLNLSQSLSQRGPMPDHRRDAARDADLNHLIVEEVSNLAALTPSARSARSGS